MLSLQAQNGPTTSLPGATIEQVRLSGGGDQTQVRVDGTGHLAYKAFGLNQPDRLVLDFCGGVVRVQHRFLSSSFYPVRLVRIGQFQATVARVVIEIEEQLPVCAPDQRPSRGYRGNPLWRVRATNRFCLCTRAGAGGPTDSKNLSCHSSQGICFAGLIL